MVAGALSEQSIWGLSIWGGSAYSLWQEVGLLNPIAYPIAGELYKARLAQALPPAILV